MVQQGPALALAALACAAACAPASPDDPAAYAVDTSVEYEVAASAPRWVVPSDALPQDAAPLASNNNVDIVFHGGLLFMAWRTAPTHFAGPDTRMYVVSSADGGASWTREHTVALGADVREPRFLSFRGRLFLHYFEGGTDPLGFEPRAIWRIERIGAGRWTVPERVLDAGEVPWDMKVRGGRAYMTSYLGVHYGSGPGEIDVLFRASDDGLAWAPVRAGAGAAVYHGGVSEVAFEFDADGSLWAVTRNEDGDASGFGSHVCHAAAADLAAWDCGVKSDPERYDSPEMFRHGKDLFLVARRDVGGPFDEGSDEPDFDKRKRDYLIHYSNRPKRTALYQIDRTERRVVWLFDLPSAGDTAFPSVQRTSAHTFLVANYTSPLDKPDRTWLQGQVADEGTQIYLLTLTFTKK